MEGCPLSGAALLDPFTVPWWNAGCELYIYMRIACKQNCLSTYIDLIGDALRTQTERSPKMCSALQTLCKHSDAAVKSRAQRVWKQLHDSSDDCLQWIASMWNNFSHLISFFPKFVCMLLPTNHMNKASHLHDCISCRAVAISQSSPLSHARTHFENSFNFSEMSTVCA